MNRRNELRPDQANLNRGFHGLAFVIDVGWLFAILCGRFPARYHSSSVAVPIFVREDHS